MLSIFNKFLRSKSTQLKSDLSLSTSLLPQLDSDGWIRPMSAKELLNTELRKKYLSMLWQQVSMSQEMFNQLYQEPIERYAEMVQLLPASEAHHHSHLGGMLDHGLEVLSFAAKLRQSYVLPQNAAPEEQSKQRDAWTAAVIYMALVHDIGKVIVDIEIHLKDGTRWFAWNGLPLQPYKFIYVKNRDYELHPVMGSYLANYLIPTSAINWLAKYPEPFTALMYGMSGHYDKANLLAEIVQKADQNSVTLALGGDIGKLTQKPIMSFAKQLLIAIRHLLQRKLTINNPKGGSDGWLTEDGLWLMSKTAADQIRAYLLEQGISAPKDNPKLFSEMQSLGIIESNEDGNAIWRCRVKAASGWTPAKTFTLIRLKPEVAWENIDARPSFFLGKVEVEKKELETEEDNTESTQPTVSHDSASNVQVAPIPEQTKSIKVGDVQDNVLMIDENATITTPNSEAPASDMADFVLNLFDPNIEAANNNISSVKEVMFNNILQNDELELEKETQKAPIPTDKKQPETQPHPVVETVVSVISGQLFVDWLKEQIISKNLGVNNVNAKLHIVQGHLFLVTPGIFHLYFESKGVPFTKQDVEQLQYSFQDLKLHRKYHRENNDSVNFWRCNVFGPRKTSKLIGYLIDDPKVFFGSQVLIDNFHLSLVEEKEKHE